MKVVGIVSGTANQEVTLLPSPKNFLQVEDLACLENLFTLVKVRGKEVEFDLRGSSTWPQIVRIC